MALCPRCRKSFSVMDDENPEDFGCPKCGYNPYAYVTNEDEEECE